MKIPRSKWLVCLFSVLLVGFVSGCQGGGPGEKVNVQAQIPNLKSPDTDTRVNACVELAKAGPDAAPAISGLIPLLKDSDPLVRRLAAYALGEIGPKAKEALPTLKELLTDSSRDVVTQAINSIRAIDTSARDIKSPPNVSQ